MSTKMKEAYVFDEGEDDDAAASLLFREMSKLPVFPRDFKKAYHLAFGPIPSLKIAPIVGMAGIGKTTLAREIFEHPNITSFFKCRVWVTAGPDCRPEQIRRAILQQIDPNADETPDEGEERSVRELLKARRYLVVLDDVWDLHLWRDLRSLFDNKPDHSCVLLTTRLQEVALGANDDIVHMSLLNKEESWNLLRYKLFGDQPCPYQLGEAGKKIAERCDGLPLTIITVANILSRDNLEETQELWTRIAENRSSVFMDAYKQMYDILYSSYDNLQLFYLKNCFLYMGIFPQSYEIPISMLNKLWSVENFLDPDPSKTSAGLTAEYLEGLHSRSLVLTVQQSSTGGIKTCRLHSVFWHLCNVEASKVKFFTQLNSYRDFFSEDLENQSRVSITSNLSLTIKDARYRIASIPLLQCLLCFGLDQRYQVRIYFDSTFLIKVLHVFSLRFYEFPLEILELVRLRYLALTCSGQLPLSITKLKSLEYLIIRRPLSLKSSRVSRYLPMEIWEMKSLKHLQIMGSNLPDPTDDALLPNLLTLLDVGTLTCTKRVLERIPHLEKLGILFDTAPPAWAEPSPQSRFDYHVSHLQNLKSLKCEVVNRVLIRQAFTVSTPRFLDLPSGLKKLTLSGFGYPWEEMSKIASLPNLEVLKLRCFAFRGPKWEARDGEFPALKYLLIEDTDLVHWTAASGSFYRIQRLILKNCYKLEAVPFKFWNNVSADVFDCNPLAERLEMRHFIPRHHRKFHAGNSWES